MSQTPWILEDVKPFKEISELHFPELSGDWYSFLVQIKTEICTVCDDCQQPDSLCDKHSTDFEWMVRLGRANVPKRYWPLELEDSILEEQEAMDFVRIACSQIDKVVGKGLGFSLFGSRGLGKTALTIYFMKAALRNGFSGFFALMESLLNMVKDSFEDQVVRERLNKIKSVRVLVLDDLGGEYMTSSGFVVARLDELFRYRDSMGLSTLFSSNLSRAEFEGRYGSGIISLLRNTNKALVVKGTELRRSLNEWGDICPTQP